MYVRYNKYVQKIAESYRLGLANVPVPSTQYPVPNTFFTNRHVYGSM